jgi:sRNA-binding regulator protein Hfq
MLKKFLSATMLVAMLLFTNLQLINGQTSGGNNAATVEKIKANVTKRGKGEKARVNVKMLNGTKLKGFISQAGDDSFTVTDSKTKQTNTLAYSDVAQVKGSGLSTGTKILVGVGVAITAVVLVVGLRPGTPLIGSPF